MLSVRILSSRRSFVLATSSNVSKMGSFNIPRAKTPSNSSVTNCSGNVSRASLGILWMLTRTVSKLISTRLGGEGMCL